MNKAIGIFMRLVICCAFCDVSGHCNNAETDQCNQMRVFSSSSGTDYCRVANRGSGTLIEMHHISKEGKGDVLLWKHKVQYSPLVVLVDQAGGAVIVCPSMANDSVQKQTQFILPTGDIARSVPSKLISPPDTVSFNRGRYLAPAPSFASWSRDSVRLYYIDGSYSEISLSCDSVTYGKWHKGVDIDGL